MKIPIMLKLKRKLHKNIAYAQDLLVEEIYRAFPKAVLHGGTAIWRCYNGDRFSEDLDFYIPKEQKKIDELFEALKKRGFVVIKRRVKKNSLFSSLRFNEVQVRFEVVFKNIETPVLKEFQTSEGLLFTVYTLNPEELINEKVETYIKRRKIRDLYDVFFLLRYADKNKVRAAITKLIKEFRKPFDEEVLRTLIISGAVPTYKQMLVYFRKWVK